MRPNVLFLLGAFGAMGAGACGSSLPAPPKGSSPLSAFVEVPAPPPPAHAERVPDRPPQRAIWVDGSWDWTGTRWRWREGGWFALPAPGLVYAEAQTIRPGGTRLLFADATWRDHNGAKVQGPALLVAATFVETDAGGARAPEKEDPGENGDAGASDAGESGDAGDLRAQLAADGGAK